MNVFKLQDKIARSLGLAASKLGAPATIYRPVGNSKPLSDHHRRNKISAAFQPTGVPVNTKGVVSPIWQGIFDSFYTRQADYLVTICNTFFIGSQNPAIPIQCVLTNRTISLSRAVLPVQVGYSGFSDTERQALLESWPASLSEIGGSSSGQRLSGQGFGNWTVLLPMLPTIPQVADVVTDDLGNTYVVDAAEQNILGWRLLARQIGA